MAASIMLVTIASVDVNRRKEIIWDPVNLGFLC